MDKIDKKLQYVKEYLAEHPDEVSKTKVISRKEINCEFSAFHRIQYYIGNLEFELAKVELQYLPKSLVRQMELTIKQAKDFYDKYGIHYDTSNYKLVSKLEEKYMSNMLKTTPTR